MVQSSVSVIVSIKCFKKGVNHVISFADRGLLVPTFHLSTGLSAAVLLLFSGDILGASGLASSTLLTPRKSITDPNVAWKLVFLSTFLLFANTILGVHFTDDERLGTDPSIPVVSIYGYLLGGLFVGFGTRLGNGCTTGHGICGMARLSKRSFVAVITFMLSAFAMAAVTAPDNKALSNATSFLRTSLEDTPDLYNRWLGFGVTMAIVLPTIVALVNLFRSDPMKSKSTPSPSVDEVSSTKGEDFIDTSMFHEGQVVKNEKKDVEQPHDDEVIEKPMPCIVCNKDEQEEAIIQKLDNIHKIAPAIVSGALFALGLAVSQMVLPSKILGFLNLFTLFQPSSPYDPTLMLVMVGGLMISFISYQFVDKHRCSFFASENDRSACRDCPILTSKFSVPTNTSIDVELIAGSIFFGIGWAVAGLCPGPAMFLAATGAQPVIYGWWPGFLFGSFVASKIKS